MIQEKINIGEVFEKGIFVTYIEKGVSSLLSKRLKRIDSKKTDLLNLTYKQLELPLNIITDAIEEDLKDVLKLFSSSSEIKKRIQILDVEPSSYLHLEDLQFLQPAIGVLVIPPGNSKDRFRVKKIKYDDKGRDVARLNILDEQSKNSRSTLVIFDSSSIAYHWILENNDQQTKKFMLILFEEIDFV